MSLPSNQHARPAPPPSYCMSPPQVNSAGIMTRGSFLEVPAREAERVMRTNYLGPYIVTQAFAPLLVKEAQRKTGWLDKPSIIMVNSFAGKVRPAQSECSAIWCACRGT